MDTKSLSFAEFAQTYLSEEGKKVSPVEFLAQLQTYEEARAWLITHKDFVYDLLVEPEGAARRIEDFLKNPAAVLAGESLDATHATIEQEKALGRLTASLPRESTSPAAVESWGIIRKTLEKNKKEVARARQITEEFNARVQKLQIYGAGVPVPSFKDLRAQAVKKKELQPIVAEYEPFFTSDEYRTLERAEIITTTVIETPDVPMAVFVDAVEQGFTKERAISFAYTATVVNTPPNQRRVQGVDAFKDVMTMVFPELRYESAERIVASAWVRITKSESLIATIADRVGEQVAQSEQFNRFIHQQIPPPSGGGIGSLLGGLSPRAQISDDEMADYAVLLFGRDPGAKIDAAEVFAAKGLHIIHFEIGGSPLDWVARWFAKKEAGVAAGAMIAKIGLGRLAGILGGPVGWIIVGGTTILSFAGSFVSKLAAGGIGSLRAASGAVGEWASSALNAPPTKDPLAVNGWLFALTLAVAPFLLAFFFTWNTTQVWRSSLVPAGVGGGENTPIVDCRTTQTNPACNGDVPPAGVDCNATQTNPQCRVEACVPQGPGDCLWPTDGYLTQGPKAIHCEIGGEDQTSHENMDAVDIGAAYNTPVIAVRGGTVTDWKSGCADQPTGSSSTWGCNGGWGNYIDITSLDGYVLRYSHLALQSMGLTYLHKPVVQGEVIGKVDNTGNSTGNHLHFGVQSGPGNIFSIIPLTQQQAQQVNGCVAVSGCPKECPVIQTSIQ